MKRTEKAKIEMMLIKDCEGETSQESPLVLGLGPAEACQPSAANALKQKDHLLEEERGGGREEG